MAQNYPTPGPALPVQLTNNSQFDDSEIYVAIIGNYDPTHSSSKWIYYDLPNNSASNTALKDLTTAVNTLHKTSGDWGYANIFTTLDKIPNKTIYVDHTHGCRIFFGFRSPMYLHAFDNAGYAGADMQNASDPNHGVRWENMEFTYDWYNVMFINTTRVDAFQYPMGVDLYGDEAAGANNPHMRRGELLNYATIINRWNTENAGTDFQYCYQDVITADNLGGIITQPSKVAAVKNNGWFDDYIDRIWAYFANNELYADMGQRGIWRGKVNGGTSFVLTNVDDASQVATVNKPTTTDVIEGAGTFATGSEIDKAVQAQFCGAMNRGVIDLSVPSGQLQNWGATDKFFKTDRYNPYVKFFHQSDISHDGYTYAFAYDDTFDQSSTCATSHPTHVVITIGGFATDPGEAVEPGGDDPDTPSGDNAGSITITDGANKDKVLNYTYEFTQQGSNVTVKFVATNASEFVGIVDGNIWDRSEGANNAMYPGLTHTWENCTEGQVIKIQHQWPMAGADAWTPEISYTVGSGGSQPEADTEAPVMTKAEASAITQTTATLTVAATDNNSGNLTYSIKNGTQEIATATAAAGADATVELSGLTAGTAYTLSITAKDAAGNVSAARELSFTTEAEQTDPVDPVEGQVLTNGEHSVTLIGYHYTNTENYELIITSEETMNGLGGSFWNINGVGGTQLSQTLTLSADGKTMTITATSNQAPQLYTPLYVMMPGEVNFGQPTINWIEKSSSDPVDPVDPVDPQPTELIDNGADANGMHKLTGPWSDDAFATIDAAAKANSYDLTDVSHNETINVIDKTANPYCLFVTSTPGTVNRNELVAEGEGYHGYAIFLQENWNDSKTYDINTSLSPITVDNPFFQRLFDRAGYYVTITVPFDYNRIPDAAAGTKFYEIAASTDNKSITFREVTAIEKNKPYLAYVATGGITIPDPGTVTIDFAAATEQSGSMSFMANYKQQTLSTGYVLPLGALAADGLTFSKAEGATLRPFRAYIANASAESRISVLFDEATGLRSATAEELGQLFNVYSIDGRVVREQTKSAANLPAGVYVINGKKVVVK